jgi:hypothetical protein
MFGSAITAAIIFVRFATEAYDAAVPSALRDHKSAARAIAA